MSKRKMYLEMIRSDIDHFRQVGGGMWTTTVGGVDVHLSTDPYGQDSFDAQMVDDSGLTVWIPGSPITVDVIYEAIKNVHTLKQTYETLKRGGPEARKRLHDVLSELAKSEE